MKEIVSNLDEFRTTAKFKKMPEHVVNAVILEWKDNSAAPEYLVRLVEATPDAFWSTATERCEYEYRLPELHEILLVRGYDGFSLDDTREKRDKDQRIVKTIEKLQKLLNEKPVNGAAEIPLLLLLNYSNDPKYREHRETLASGVDNLTLHMRGPTPDHLLECLKGAIEHDGMPKSITYAPETRKLPRQTGPHDRIAMQYFMQQLIQWFDDGIGSNTPEDLITKTVEAIHGEFNGLPEDCDIMSVYRAAKKNLSQ